MKTRLIAKKYFMDMTAEDKAKYYNSTRMSMRLFNSEMQIPPNWLNKELQKHGYEYDEENRLFIKKMDDDRKKDVVIVDGVK